MREKAGFAALVSLVLGLIDGIGQTTIPDAIGLTVGAKPDSIAARIYAVIAALPLWAYALLFIILLIVWVFWDRLFPASETGEKASSVTTTASGSAFAHSVVGNNNVVTLNVTVAQAQAVAETATSPAAEAVAGRIFLDRAIGVFPDEIGDGSHTKFLLLIHVINRGPATVISDFNFSVRAKDGKPVEIGWITDQSIVPRSTEENVPFRSMSYIAQNPIAQGAAVDVYAYCALRTFDYNSVDRTTWEATFEDAHGKRYTARPTSGMLKSAV